MQKSAKSFFLLENVKKHIFTHVLLFDCIKKLLLHHFLCSFFFSYEVRAIHFSDNLTIYFKFLIVKISCFKFFLA